MNRTEGAALLLECAVQGLIDIRTTGRDVSRGDVPDGSSDWPGSPAAEEYIAAVASTCHCVRFLCSKAAGADARGARKIVADAWAGTGELGRFWMAKKFGNSGRGWAVNEMDDLVGRNTDRTGFLPRGPEGHVRSRLTGRSVTRWCEDMVLGGLVDIYHLVTDVPREDAAERALRFRRIAAISDACHRIPFPSGNVLGVNAIQFPLRIADGWARNSPEGREWCRQRSSALPYEVPWSVRRVLDREP